eukprot:INCI4112.1.p1 GENE.INCI4112.1~~INCI4112.1.p1  ORF type:complete len:636 (+),score=83.73 INCI4112.1:119-2026(+)
MALAGILPRKQLQRYVGLAVGASLAAYATAVGARAFYRAEKKDGAGAHPSESQSAALRRLRMFMAPAFWTSLFRSLWSTRLHSMIGSSLFIAWAIRRFTGIRRVRIFFPLFFGMIWAMYYKIRCVETAVVNYQRTFWNMQIVEKAKLNKMKFRPVPWAFNRHAQTTVCLVLSAFEWLFRPIEYTTEEIQNPSDGNTIQLHWSVWSAASGIDRRRQHVTADSPIILMIHGLGDDRFHPYLLRFSRLAHTHGYRTCCLSYWRADFGMAVNGSCLDIATALDHIQAKNPNAPIVACAWSAGGHLLLRYLQYAGRQSPLVAAVSMSGCFNLLGAIDDVDNNENASYKFFLNVQMQRVLRRHVPADTSLTDKQRNLLRQVPNTHFNCKRAYFKFLDMLMCFRAKNQGVDVETLVYELPADAKREEAHIPWTVKRAAMQRAQAARKHVATARAKASSGDLQAESASPANVETPLVAPDMNLPTYAQLRTMSDQDIFDSVMNDQEFAVQQCMTDLGPNMRRVQVTTLVLQAEDDPIVSEKHVDWNKLSANKNIITMHTNRGGHVAWYEGFGPGGTTWNDRVAMRFISACLESHCQTNFMLNVFRTFLNNSALTDGPDVSQVGLKLLDHANAVLPSTDCRICA